MESFLDKLIDDDLSSAESGHESQKAGDVRRAQDSLIRDLGNLLGTRTICATWGPERDQLSRSVLNYGILDLTGMSFSSSAMVRLLQKTVEVAVARFEPRLSNVNIRIDVNPVSHNPRVVVTADSIAGDTPRHIAIVTNVGGGSPRSNGDSGA